MVHQPLNLHVEVRAIPSTEQGGARGRQGRCTRVGLKVYGTSRQYNLRLFTIALLNHKVLPSYAISGASVKRISNLRISCALYMYLRRNILLSYEQK